MRSRKFFAVAAAAIALCVAAGASGIRHTTNHAAPAAAPTALPPPWMNQGLSADERASLVEREMTQSEKIALVHGIMALPFWGKLPQDVIGGSGFVPGNARLAIPALQETDASLGVTNPFNVRPGDGATALPSGLATAATFNEQLAYDGAAMIGREAWSKGFNVLLAGGVNLAREPRNGRNFEYLGEDPLLAGTLAGAAIRGIQDQHVISTVKHYVINDQETGRFWANAVIDEAALRESDLLAFELAIEKGKPGSVMCSYNLINGAYGCGNDRMLNGVLKGDWKYAGWVMSDWGAVHGVNDALAGLDQESGEQVDKQVYFNKPLEKALTDGTVPAERLDDMVHRILRSMFAVGLFDKPAVKTPIDYVAHASVAQKVAEEGIVLLKNRDDILPLTAQAKRIAVIGGRADLGVLSGAGSSQVTPYGGAAAEIVLSGTSLVDRKTMVLDPSSPFAAIKAMARGAEVRFDPGRYVSSAAALAKWADVVVVFANQWMTEGVDAPDLSLPDGQDELIVALANVNPKTVVVLQTGGPVTMPWLGDVSAVLEAWYPGQKGGQAIANVLFGSVNPSGHLPMTFPASVRQNPRPAMPGSDREFPPLQSVAAAPFDIKYMEGSDVGYRWFASKRLKPLFPFGYGLSYTGFKLSNLTVSGGEDLTVGFDVTNTGVRAGKAAPQVYLTSSAGERVLRLIGFAKVPLDAGETRHISITADPRLLGRYDARAAMWQVTAGDYSLMVGQSAGDGALAGTTTLNGRALAP